MQTDYLCLVPEHVASENAFARSEPGVVTILDESAIAARFQSCDEAVARDAFAVMFSAYYESVVYFATRYVLARDIAEDVAQDAFVRVWERRASVNPSGSVRALLFAAARNRSLDLLEHDSVVNAHARQTIARYSDIAETPMAPAADESVLATELAQLAAIRVAGLPPRQREIYQLSREDGLSPAEIAAVLGISPATVYVQLARIVHALFPALGAWTTDR